MSESIILGIIQGIAEWLPISSEGFLVLAQVSLFNSNSPLQELIKISLFLHLGTFLAAFFYFWKDVKNLTKKLFLWKTAEIEEKNIIKFLVLTTILTSIIGGILLLAIQGIEERIEIELGGQIAMAIVGILLLITGALQLHSRGGTVLLSGRTAPPRENGLKTSNDIRLRDGILLGIMQSFAVLPGLSRSGLTVAGLLLRKFNDETALRLSFLMSLPVVLAGNIFFNIDKFRFDTNFFWGLLASFLFGFITIHYLLKIAKKVNFGYFLLGFGILVIITAFI